MGLATYSDTIAERLQSRLRPATGGCLVWTGAVNHSGYGRLSRGGRGNGYDLTHRIAWELANGRPIPDGMFVLHKCDNPPCCNAEHLFIGTAADNSHDMMSKGRGRGQLPSGRKHPSARLTDEQVAELRAIASTIGNHAELGRRFGISKQHARSLVLGLKRASL